MSERTAPFGLPIVAAAFGTQAVAIGLSISAYPVFMTSLEEEFGVGRFATSLGIPVLLLASAVASPWIGRALDRGSPRRIMAAGALALTAGLVAVSLSPGFALAAFFWVALVGVGVAMLGPLAAMTVLANWFVARRARMIAIAAMGGAFGAALSPPLGALLIETLGWRTAAACLGLACSAIALPIVLRVIVKRPEEIGAHPDGADGALPSEPAHEIDTPLASFLRDARFWLLAAGVALLGGSLVTFATHVVPWATERGLSREAAVGLLTINATLGAVGKLLFGDLTDRLGARPAMLLGVALAVLGWTGMIAVAAPIPFTVCVACFALGAGCVIPCQAGYVAGLFGRARFGRATGLLHLFSMAGTLVLPPLVGFAFEASAGYALPMTAMLAVLAGSGLCFALVDPRDRTDAPVAAASRPDGSR